MTGFVCSDYVAAASSGCDCATCGMPKATHSSSKDALRTVPREPTPEMHDAAWAASLAAGEPMSPHFPEINAAIYRAMIDAAPSPDTAPGTGAEGMRELLARIIDPKTFGSIDHYASLPQIKSEEAVFEGYPDLRLKRDEAFRKADAVLAALSQPAPGQDVPEPRPATRLRLGDYPIGTKAYGYDGGGWTRVENGWKATGGDTFPRPGGSAYEVELPEPRPAGGEALARAFHEAYERLAPQFGYETRPDTRDFDPNSKNGKLMIAVCQELAFGPAGGEAVLEEAYVEALNQIVRRHGAAAGFHYAMQVARAALALADRAEPGGRDTLQLPEPYARIRVHVDDGISVEDEDGPLTVRVWTETQIRQALAAEPGGWEEE